MNTGATTAEVMAAYLSQSGTSHVFGYPGDPTIELMEQLRRQDIPVVLARREGTAGFMAEGYAMATGRLGVVLSTLGPGSTALVNPVAAATLDRVPMLAISGQIETRREQFFTHQVVDHKLLFSPVSKWAGRIEEGSVATVMRRAMRLATAERPGAVHLTAAADTFKLVATDAEIVLPPLGPSATSIQVHLANGASDPHRILAAARRPVLLAGIGATRAGAGASLVRTAETLGIPVVVAPMAKGVFPENHPYFAGVLDMACNQVMWDLMASSDLVVAAGFDAVELIKPWAVTSPVLHIDASANTDQIYASDCELVGDIGVILDWLSEGGTGQVRWEEAEVAAHRQVLSNAYYQGRVSGRMNPTDVVDVVQQAAAPGTVVTSDVGSHKLLVGQGWQALEPRSVLMTNGLSAMGFGVPAAIGAALARPDRSVISLVGDGGFAMAATEVRLATQLGLPITFVVFVDGSLNRIELKQMAAGYPSTATRIEDMDLVGMARAMDCEGVRAESVAELENAVADIGTRTKPLIVEAHIDPSQYESQF
jgi:acetolactate synthase I/II/III large subunit